MTYQERVAALKRGARYNPEMTDRELSIMIDAAFAEPEDEEQEGQI